MITVSDFIELTFITIGTDGLGNVVIVNDEDEVVATRAVLESDTNESVATWIKTNVAAFVDDAEWTI